MCPRKSSCGGFASAQRRTPNTEADWRSNWALSRARPWPHKWHLAEATASFDSDSNTTKEKMLWLPITEYLRPGKVEVQSIDYPEMKTPQGKKIDHGVIIKPITTNICGSDQHMVRGRTTAPAGLVLGHKITGE